MIPLGIQVLRQHTSLSHLLNHQLIRTPIVLQDGSPALAGSLHHSQNPSNQACQPPQVDLVILLPLRDVGPHVFDRWGRECAAVVVRTHELWSLGHPQLGRCLLKGDTLVVNACFDLERRVGGDSLAFPHDCQL